MIYKTLTDIQFSAHKLIGISHGGWRRYLDKNYPNLAFWLNFWKIIDYNGYPPISTRAWDIDSWNQNIVLIWIDINNIQL
jgi:hypothetical protein